MKCFKTDDQGIITDIVEFSDGDDTTAIAMGYTPCKWGNIGDKASEDMLLPKPDIQITSIGPDQQLEYLIEFARKTLNNAAIAKGYDSILSAVSYTAVPGPYQQESINFARWQSDMWQYVFGLTLTDVALDVVSDHIQTLIEGMPKLSDTL